VPRYLEQHGGLLLSPGRAKNYGPPRTRRSTESRSRLMDGWAVLDEKRSSYAATSAVFVAVCAVNVPSPLYPTYQHAYHLSATVLTAIFATFAVGVLAALVLVGPLSDHIGRKPVLIAGESILVLSEALFLGAHGVGWLFAARAAQGFALGTISSAASAALAELNRANLHQAALMTTMAFTVAGTISCVGTGFLAQYLPWHTTLCYIVLLAANLVSLGAVSLMGEPGAARRGHRYRVRLPRIPRSILGPVLVACGAMAVGWTLGGVYGSLSPSIVDLLLKGNGLVISGAVLSVFNLVGGVCQYVARRHEPHRVMIVAIAATMVGAVAMNLSLDAKSLALFFVATVFAGIGAALVFVGSLALVNRLSPVASRAETVTAYSMSGYLALAISTVALGTLVTHVGLRSAAAVLTPILVVAGALSLFSILRTGSAPAPSPHGADAAVPTEVEVSFTEGN
jgi:MFS family permease